MTMPAQLFPTVIDWQEQSTIKDVQAAAAQKANVTLTGTYASSGAITITVTNAFTAWPNYGVIQNLTTNEKLFFTKTSNSVLAVAAAARGVGGTSAAAGAIGENIRFLDMCATGALMNQLLVEMQAVQNALAGVVTLNTATATTILIANSHRKHVNTGASGSADSRPANLCDPVAGAELKFIDVAGLNIRLVASASKKIRYGSILSKAAGYLEFETAEAYRDIELYALDTAEWIVRSRPYGFNIETA